MSADNPLAKLSAATTALAASSNLEEVKHILDIAEAARTYARAAKLGLEAQNHAAELKIRAERKAGELLQQLERSNGGRPSKTSDMLSPVSAYRQVLEENRVEERQAQRWQQEASVPDELFEEYVDSVKAEASELTSAGLLRLLKQVAASDSDEWYTPVEFIEAARRVMGSIDLDPASCLEAQKVIQAGLYYTPEDDGLAQVWRAQNVWLNPPYSEPRPWVEKILTSLAIGSIECAILLVNTANSPLWARPLWRGSATVCLLERRVRFWRPDRSDAKGFDRDQMIWYLGSDVNKFRSVFDVDGAIR